MLWQQLQINWVWRTSIAHFFLKGQMDFFQMEVLKNSCCEETEFLSILKLHFWATIWLLLTKTTLPLRVKSSDSRKQFPTHTDAATLLPLHVGNCSSWSWVAFPPLFTSLSLGKFYLKHDVLKMCIFVLEFFLKYTDLFLFISLF